ncbi:MAG: hypothetical protein KDB23_19385, partial [Planctomycetales bacterium]|nr:hypothetical protein [Planctomycetales bacterium]
MISIVLALGFVVIVSVARGQDEHSDIEVALDGSRLITQQRIYESQFPESGITRHYTNEPGFVAEADGLGLITPRLTLRYDLLEDLVYWNGFDFLAPADDVRVRIEHGAVGTGPTYVSVGTGMQLAGSDLTTNRIGTANELGAFHSHLAFYLEPNEASPPLGAYGVKLRLVADADDVLPSEPLYLVFNYGMDESEFDAGLDLFVERLSSGGLVGDFDGSGALDVADIDLLTSAARAVATDLTFDLSQDGGVDEADRRMWIEELRS